MRDVSSRSAVSSATSCFRLISSDAENLIRMDDWELDEKVQSKVMEIWNQISTENLFDLSDLKGYWEDFYHMFGFHFDCIDYAKDVDICVEIPSLNSLHLNTHNARVDFFRPAFYI